MPGYKYRSNDPEPAPTPEGTGKCGEYRGYRQHKRDNTPPCEACREANRVYSQNRRRAA